MDAIGPIALFAFLPLGVALLWILRLAYRGRRAAADDPLRLVLSIAGWLFILAGLLGATAQVLLVAAPVGWGIVAAILAEAAARYRQFEHRALLWCLSIAAEKGIPIEQAVRAFSQERGDELGIRAARLADLLESGMPLGEALRASRVQLPTDAVLAVGMGCETGQLGLALGQVTRADFESEQLARSALEKAYYLLVVVVVLSSMLMFLMLRIIPIFSKMFEEFALELPQSTRAVIALADFGAGALLSALPVLSGLSLLVVLFGLLATLGHSGWLARDGSLVTRSLALSIRQGIPLEQTIELLSRIYPRRKVRARLRAAGRQIQGGGNWRESLLRVGLLRPADAGVLEAAGRVGNLEWALEEMADSRMRRWAYHLRLWLGILFPMAVLLCGLLIALVVIGLFQPMVCLIQGLL